MMTIHDRASSNNQEEDAQLLYIMVLAEVYDPSRDFVTDEVMDFIALARCLDTTQHLSRARATASSCVTLSAILWR